MAVFQNATGTDGRVAGDVLAVARAAAMARSFGAVRMSTVPAVPPAPLPHVRGTGARRYAGPLRKSPAARRPGRPVRGRGGAGSLPLPPTPEAATAAGTRTVAAPAVPALSRPERFCRCGTQPSAAHAAANPGRPVRSQETAP